MDSVSKRRRTAEGAELSSANPEKTTPSEREEEAATATAVAAGAPGAADPATVTVEPALTTTPTATPTVAVTKTPTASTAHSIDSLSVRNVVATFSSLSRRSPSPTTRTTATTPPLKLKQKTSAKPKPISELTATTVELASGINASTALSCECPICLDRIKDAFMAKCGHSFCYECISTYLTVKHNCPTCGSLIADSEIYPNFSLNSMISKSSLSPRDPGADFELAAVSADNSSIKEIDTMLLALIEKRKQLESNEKEIQLELLAEFLKKSKYEKEQELANLNEQISCINEDLQLVKMELNRSKPSQTSFENSAPKPVHNSFDFQHVPSTPISAQPTTTARLNMPVVAASSASVCSSPLPPELPGTVTPHAANMSSWNIPNSTLTTGSIFDALADEKNHHSGSRKRPHDKINDIDEQPPLEFTPFRQSTTADSSAMMTQLIRTRMSRVESHFPDLQNNYFSLRLGHQNNHKTMGSTGKLPSNAYQAHQRRDKGGNASHRTPSPSIPSSSASPLATGMRPFSETLSRFSKVSSFKTLARINYADKLVSGVGSSGGAAASGSSCIVSAIEFDADDRLFATAGVTKKIKIYEYESVVRDWGELFGGGSKQRREKARWLGGRKRAGLFVADALKDEDNDEDDSSDEDENDELFDDQNSRNFTEEVPRYPVLEMSGRSKISWLSWNSYIKSHLASSDYEGIVSLWDSNTGVLISEFEEHEKRTWSVDFNNVDPVLLASGSDDSKVKIWSTTQSGSVQTIDSKANICSVKWNPYSSHELAFGSADHHIHYYDLRNSSEPLHVLQGHRKAVSYVKFLSRNEIISASTDSTLKLWNLGSQGPPEPASVSATQSSSVSSLFAPLSSFIEANLVENLTSSIFRKSASSTLNLQKTSVRQTLSNLPVRNQHQYQQPQCMRSYSGHTNEKNFVGLSINSTGEFISCGSENNSVYTYFSSLSTPIINHRFGNAINTENGDEVLDPDPSHFVSSVCWMRKTADVLIAANSVGGVKVMQCV